MSDAKVDVYGLATTFAVDRNGNYGSAELYLVNVPENALAAMSEGFCPACRGVPLAGDTGRWCPACKVHWNIRRSDPVSAP